MAVEWDVLHVLQEIFNWSKENVTVEEVQKLPETLTIKNDRLTLYSKEGNPIADRDYRIGLKRNQQQKR